MDVTMGSDAKSHNSENKRMQHVIEKPSRVPRSSNLKLCDELQDALDDKHRLINSYYHTDTIYQTPNPCLCVAGLGVIGLPLSEGDVRRIVSICSVTSAQDIWEIEPRNVTFANPHWLSYVEDTVKESVLTALRVRQSSKQLVLHKLVLCGTGSQLPVHDQETRADGVFATVIIVLPSAFTGGQIHVTYVSSSEVIDVAPSSLFGTSVLAWYKDIRHHYQPVASGYRLALHYNLVHCAPQGASLPKLPDMVNATCQLQNVLRNWRDGLYRKPIPSSIAYVLDHRYSVQELEGGIKSLKTSDLHKLTFLLPTAKELGYVVALGSLLHVIKCYVPNDGYYSEDAESSEDVKSSEDDEYDDKPGTFTSISDIVNLDGVAIPGLTKLDIDAEGFLSGTSINKGKPDGKKYEPFAGFTSESRQVDYRFFRTAMVLIHESKLRGASLSSSVT